MPTAEDIRQVYEKYAAAWSNGDVDAVLALFAADAVVHVPSMAPQLKASRRSASSSPEGLVRDP